MRVSVSATIISPYGNQQFDFEAEIVEWDSDIPLPQGTHMIVVASIFYELVPYLRIVEKHSAGEQAMPVKLFSATSLQAAVNKTL